MDDLQLKNVPVANTAMLIRRPVAEVFRAFIDPAVTTKFWFTRSTGPLEVGKAIESGWSGNGDELLKYVADSTQGFTWTLAGLKALLEHGIQLNRVADRFPKGVAEP
jgi:hypothetical protein